MGIFGWDYPPGCSGTPFDDPVYCEVCGGSDDAKPGSGYECVCPECPECGEIGNPDCYVEHGMQITEAQKKRQAEMDERFAREALDP